MSEQKPVVIVDGTAILFSSFYSIPNMKDINGNSNGAIYGVINKLESILKAFNPEHIALVFDPPGGSFRNEIYAEYKANRGVMDDNLRIQIQPLYEIVQALGYPFFCIPGFEADDVIGSLAKQLSAQGIPSVVVSNDKDFLQLIDDNISLYVKENIVNKDNAHEKFGIDAKYTIDYLAICGDSSDNIPGVKGIGAKGAATLINDYGSLDQIYANIANIKSAAICKKLQESKDNAYLSYSLATIKVDIDLNFNLASLKPKVVDKEQILALFAQQGFRRFTDMLEKNNLAFLALQETGVALSAPVETPVDEAPKIKAPKVVRLQDINFISVAPDLIPSAANFLRKTTLARYIDRPDLLVDLQTKLVQAAQQEKISITLNYLVSKEQSVWTDLLALSIEYNNEIYYLSNFLTKEQWTYNAFAEHFVVIQAFVKELLCNPNIVVNCYQIKGLAHVLAIDYSQDIILNNVVDLMNLAACLDSTSKVDINSLLHRYFNIDFEENILELLENKELKSTVFKKLNSFQQQKYFSYITYIIKQSIQVIQEQFTEQTQNLYLNIERDIWQLLYDMEYKGITLDLNFLTELSDKFAQELAILEAKAYALAAKKFNLNSPAQVKDILFEDLKLGAKIKTKNTSAEVLEKMQDEHEIIQVILDYRSLHKLKATYTDSLPKEVDQHNKVHTFYNQFIAVTGRLSSLNPNLQNIPIRSEQGQQLRRAFIADSNEVLISFDYSQIELRIFAFFAQEQVMLDAFANNIDIHLATAAQILHKDISEISSQERSFAKSINFGLIYGMGERKLAAQLKIDVKEAKAYKDSYFARFSSIQNFIQQTKNTATQLGYVDTLNGRRIYLKELQSDRNELISAAERAAVNYPIQGTAAEIIKLAMLNLKPILAANPELKLLLQIHDELVFSIKEELLTPNLIAQIKEVMENVFQEHPKAKNLPLKVEYGIGKNWLEAH